MIRFLQQVRMHLVEERRRIRVPDMDNSHSGQMLICPHVRDIEIRPLGPGDLEAVVDLQAAFLDGSLLTDLGTGFLVSFYTAALAHPNTRACVAVDSGAIVGAAIASTEVGHFNRFVKPRIFVPLAIAIASPKRWRVLPSLLQSLREHEPAPPIPAELLTLIVDGRRRQQGVGRRLLDALEAEFASERIPLYRVAVRSHLAIARAFYEATGFVFEQQLQVLGRPMTYLTKTVAAHPPPR